MIFLEFLKMEKKFCAYMRVSTTDQTVESQDRILKQYFEANGIKNPEFFIDHGISGTKANRPALDRMMAMVEADQVSTIVVYSFSRFARSTTHLLNALQVFKKKGVQFVSLTERIDTSSAVGLALFSILAAISQLERDLIADRVKAGLAAARARGKLIARTDVQKLVTDAAKFNVSTTLDAAVKNQATDMQLIEDRLNALLTEIKAFAQIATSLFNNLHANAGTSYNVSVS
jgi:DNA invertase Pin-like site-specific DNA recombinase